MKKLWKDLQIEFARKKFAEHIAIIQQYDAIQIIDWKNKNGSTEYYVRYILDSQNNHLFISGDLGTAVFKLTWHPTLDNMQNRLMDTYYIVDKLVEQDLKYVYPAEYVKEELMELLMEASAENREMENNAVTICEKLSNYCNYKTGWDVDLNDSTDSCMCELKELLEILGCNPKHIVASICSIGRRVNPIIYLWIEGLKMSYEQLTEREVS